MHRVYEPVDPNKRNQDRPSVTLAGLLNKRLAGLESNFLLIMKKRSLVLIFISSAALGWLSRGSILVMNPQQAVKTAQTRPERKSGTRPTPTAREAEFLAFVRRVPTLNDKEKDAFSKNLAPKNRGAMIETLLKEGDPSGLSHEGYGMVNSILKIWVAEDFESAWTWSQQITNDACRRFVTGKLLDEMAKKDLARALALHLEMNAADPKFKSSVPLVALEATTPKSASDFLNVLGKIPLHGGGTRHFEFAKDFNFQQAAAGISALLGKQNQLPDEFPMNFIGV